MIKCKTSGPGGHLYISGNRILGHREDFLKTQEVKSMRGGPGLVYQTGSDSQNGLSLEFSEVFVTIPPGAIPPEWISLDIPKSSRFEAPKSYYDFYVVP